MKETLIILFVHFVADFILQTDKMALNKSKSNYWLSAHVSMYMIPFSLILIVHPTSCGLAWITINWMMHFVTDFFTSRLTSYLWIKEKRHWFFVAIGADQFIHFCCLLISYKYLIKATG